MKFSTKIKLEIEDLGKVWDVTYRIPEKKDDKKIAKLSEKIMKEENEKQEIQKEILEGLKENPKDENLRKSLEEIDLMSVEEFRNQVDEYAFKSLVSGYDDEFIEYVSKYSGGFTMALAEVKTLHSEVMGKKPKK